MFNLIDQFVAFMCYNCCVSRYRQAYAKSIPLPSTDQWEIIDKNYTIGPHHAKRPRKKIIQPKGWDDSIGGGLSRRIRKCTRCQGFAIIEVHVNTQ